MIYISYLIIVIIKTAVLVGARLAKKKFRRFSMESAIVIAVLKSAVLLVDMRIVIMEKELLMEQVLL